VICGGQGGTETYFSPSTLFSPVSTIPPVFHTQLHLHDAFTIKAKGQRLGIFQKATLFRQSGGLDKKVVRYSFLFRLPKVEAKSFLEVTSCNFEYRKDGRAIKTLQQIAL